MFSSFINDVQIRDVTPLMGLKVEMNFGTFQKKFKIPWVGRFSKFCYKSNFLAFFGLIFKRKIFWLDF